jgi:hypothetical protein
MARLRARASLGLLLAIGGVACAGPHTTGALWSQQYVDQEKAFFALSDAQRRAQTQQFALGLADEGLQAETARIDAALQTCPGPSVPLAVSPGDMRRDVIRIQADGDTARLGQTTQLALADWYLRRAGASTDAHFCQLAEAARNAQLPQPATTDLLDGLPIASVSRDPRQTDPPMTSDSPLATLSRYALGEIDAVSAQAPLPQYLALVYGGALASTGTALDAETAAARVDAQVAAYPDWEPDALYAALRDGRL